MLSTSCGECLTEVAAFQRVSDELTPAPIIGVIGPADERAEMVESLTGHAIVLEEAAFGPVAEAFGIREFPAVLLIRDGHIQLAEHQLAPVLAARSHAVATATAGPQH